MKRKAVHKNLLFSFVTFFLATAIYAQNCAGVYRDKGNSPNGGVTYILLPDNTFAITYFGGIVTGTYEQKGDAIYFKNRKEPKFVVYARKLETLNDTIQIRFKIRENEGVAIGFAAQTTIAITPVFNKNANCFSYPYILKQTTPVANLFIGNVPYKVTTTETNLDLFHFEKLETYNDFLLINLQREYTTALDFSARYINDMLYVDGSNKGLSKRELSTLNEEDMAFLNQYIQTAMLPKTLTSDNEFFPYSSNPTKTKQTPYSRIEATILPKHASTVLEGSFFSATCDDE